MGSQLAFRFRAAAIHATASIAAALLAAGLVFFLWYPWPYRVISGGTELFLLVMGVDVILGPLITLAVFDPRKPRKELWRDMAVVVLIQLSALGYGLHTVYIARPVVLALEGDRFRASNAAAIQIDELPKAQAPFQALSLTGPVTVNTATPTADAKYDAIMMGMAGADLGTRPSYWRDWNDQARRDALKVGKPLATLVKGTCPGVGASICDAIARSGKPIEQLLYIPVFARRTDWSVLIDKTTGDPVGFVPLDGF